MDAMGPGMGMMPHDKMHHHGMGDQPAPPPTAPKPE